MRTLKTLTVIQDAVNLIRAHTPDFSIDDITLEDKTTFDLLNAGETIGVFQLESGGMIALCKQFGVDRIEGDAQRGLEGGAEAVVGGHRRVVERVDGDGDSCACAD